MDTVVSCTDSGMMSGSRIYKQNWSVGLGPAPGGPGAVPTCAHSSLGDVSAGGKLTARSGSQACSSLEAFVCL